MKRLPSYPLLLGLAVTAAILGACRGQESDKPPVHLNPNMDSQPRVDPQSESKFYSDRRSMRQPVEGTIAQNALYEGPYGTGKDSETRYTLEIPMPITMELLKRGQDRFGIYCTPCHDRTGYGHGMVVRGRPWKPTNFHDSYARTMSDGQMFDAITHGARTMPAYGPQIPVKDRWAIVAYVRALQFSQAAALGDVPPEQTVSLKLDTQTTAPPPKAE
jgi:hypothetical protein